MPGSQCAPREEAERSEPTIRVLGFPTKPKKPSLAPFFFEIYIK